MIFLAKEKNYLIRKTWEEGSKNSMNSELN